MQTPCANGKVSQQFWLRETSGAKVKISSVTEKEKSKGICTEGYPEKYHFLLLLRIHNHDAEVYPPIPSWFFFDRGTIADKNCVLPSRNINDRADFDWSKARQKKSQQLKPKAFLNQSRCNWS